MKDMYDIEAQMEEEAYAERIEFAKVLLKRKSEYINNLDRVVDKLKEELESVVEEYDEILELSVDDVCDAYQNKPVKEYIVFCFKDNAFEVCG